jgi:hypothetical protein
MMMMSRAGGLAPANALAPLEAPTPFASGYAAAVPAPDAEVRDLDDPAVLSNKAGFRDAVALATGSVRPWQYSYDRLHLGGAHIPVPANFMGVSVGRRLFPGGAEAAAAPGGMDKLVSSTQKIPDAAILRTAPVKWQMH